MKQWDVIIAGAGPSGSTLASLLARQGFAVALFERQAFPRHQIGESLLPHSMRVLDKTGAFARLRDGDFVKKPGATFFSEHLGKSAHFPFSSAIDPRYPYAFNVERAPFDKLLLDVARDHGVSVFQPVDVRDVRVDEAGVTVNAEHQAPLIVWANGIGNVGSMADNYVVNDEEDRKTSIFGYFDADFSGQESYGNIIVNLFRWPDQESIQWAWCIPLRRDFASVGFVLSSDPFKNRPESARDLPALFDELLDRNQNMLKFCRRDRPRRALELRHNFQRVAKQMVFDRQLLLGDAAGFIDPVFSSGVHIGLMGANKASEVIARVFAGKGRFQRSEMLEYESFYRQTFWTYYKVVKLFYQRNVVENLFFDIPDPEGADARDKIREFTSILGGDSASRNSLLETFRGAPTKMNSQVAALFEGVGGGH